MEVLTALLRGMVRAKPSATDLPTYRPTDLQTHPPPCHYLRPSRLTEAFAIAMDDCDGVFLSVDIDVCDPDTLPARVRPSRVA